MKRKIKTTAGTFIVIIVLLMAGNHSMAQQREQQRGQQGPPPIPDTEEINKMVTDLSKELSLTEMQEKQVSKLYFAHFEEVGKMREKNKNSQGANRAEMEKVREGFEKDIKSILTEEQQGQFDTFQKERRSKRKGQKRQGRVNPDEK